jgi:hypothetical protein
MHPLDALMANPGLYLGRETTHEGGTDHIGVARVVVTALPGGGGVTLDYEVLSSEGVAAHTEHAVLTRTASGVVLVTAHSHAPIAAVVPEDPAEPGWFPAPPEAAPFPMAVRVETPGAGHLVYSWSYASPGEELSVRDQADVRRVG